MRFTFLLLLILGVVAYPASAQTLQENGISAYVEYSWPSLVPGRVVNDVHVVTTSSWLSAQLLVLLDDGAIHQDSQYDQCYPQPGFWSLCPELEFDSFVADGESPPGAPSIAGGAANIGGGATYTHDTGLIDIAWFKAGSTAQGDIFLTRVTLSSDAQGTWSYYTTALPSGAGGPYVKLMDMPIVDGMLTIVPEPGTLSLLAAGLLLCRRRR